MYSEPVTGRVARWYIRKRSFQRKYEKIGYLNDRG
jgi:hypothetical protein